MDSHCEAEPETIEEIKNAIKNGQLKEFCENYHLRLKIAITGETGAGKSSFINAFRGIGDDDEGAAPTGVVETTMEIKDYQHPSYPNVIFSDLPGIGSSTFKAKTYCKDVRFKDFDCFIIISADRFRENDVKLAKEITKMKKKLYFVRSKIDEDLQNAKRKKDFNEEKTLASIRENCVKGLKKLGIESPDVFLVSNPEIHLYDFNALIRVFERDLPKTKMDALLLASPCVSPDIVMRKKIHFKRFNWGLTALSGIVGAAPVPGLSVAVDLSLLVGTVTNYVSGFGLDIPSLKRLSARTGIPYKELKAVLKSKLSAVEITTDLIKKIVLQISCCTSLMAAQEVCKFIPVIGIPASSTLTAVTTYNLLKMMLDLLAEDALRLSEKVLKNRH